MTVTTDPRKTGIDTEVSIGAGTFAQMKAATGMADGALFRVTNYGKGGSLWRYSSTLTEWFPTAPLKVYENTALISGVAQTADQLLVAIPLEANLIKGKVFKVYVTAGKSGTTDTMTLTPKMGSNGTIADASLGGLTAYSAGTRAAGSTFAFRMASATSAERLGGPNGAPFFGGTTGSAINAATTVADVTTQTVNFDLCCTMSGTADTPQLGYVALEIQP
jgi:hypothetical protein